MGIEMGGGGEGGSDHPDSPHGRSLDSTPERRGIRSLAEKVASAADTRGLSYAEIAGEVGGADHMAELRRRLQDWRPDDGGYDMRGAVATVEARLVTEEPVTIGINHEESSGLWLSWWRPDGDLQVAAPVGEPFGRIVVFESQGVTVAEKGRHTSRYYYVLDASDVDLAVVFDDPQVRHTLGMLATDPRDRHLRADAVAAVMGVRPAGPPPWRELALPDGDTSWSHGAGPLDGTIAVIGSRGVSIGNHVRHSVTFMATFSPTLDGAVAVAGDRKLAGALVDLACGGGPAAARRAANGMTRTLEAAMAGAPELRRATPVEQIPGPGQILTVRHEYGAAVGPSIRVIDRHSFDVQGLTLREPDLGSFKTISEREAERDDSGHNEPGKFKSK
jgi:hypothetical protein